MRPWLLLFFRPMLQAIVSSMGVLAMTQMLYFQAGALLFTMNMIWWANMNGHHQMRHHRWSGTVYSSGITIGTLIGMFLFGKATQ